MLKNQKIKICLLSGADICSKCWTLMRFAMQIIDRVLHGLFYFKTKIKKKFLFFEKRILDLNIVYGYILVDVVFIVGFVIKQQENYNQVFDKLLLNI